MRVKYGMAWNEVAWSNAKRNTKSKRVANKRNCCKNRHPNLTFNHWITAHNYGHSFVICSSSCTFFLRFTSTLHPTIQHNICHSTRSERKNCWQNNGQINDRLRKYRRLRAQEKAKRRKNGNKLSKVSQTHCVALCWAQWKSWTQT